MKTSVHFTILYTLTVFASLWLIACESHEQKADDAFEYVRQRKATTDTLNAIIEETIIEKDKPKTVFAKNQVDEWVKFKIEIEKKISLNELKIIELKNKQKLSFKLKRKLTNIENENNDLIKKIENFKEEEKVNRENFKIDINHQVNSFEIDLNDMK